LEVEVDETGITGTSTDELGRTRCFSGWLALIATLHPSEAPEDPPADRSSADAWTAPEAPG
jgi:hypothetical protein